VLQLLGDELLGNDRLAVFELVKNAYDADADKVVICLDLTSESGPSITVTDDGEGMTLDRIRSVWLAPGDDYRWRQRGSGQRTPRHQRLPLGEKGLGRFAVHKLGNRITLVTRARDSQECVIEIDWNELIAKPYLDEASVSITVRDAEVFPGEATGTRIEVRELRNAKWSRGEVRRLHNQVTSICSPFAEVGDFKADLQVPGHEDWIRNLPDIAGILDRAIWKYSFWLDKGQFDWSYEFCPAPGLKLAGRSLKKQGEQLQLPRGSGDRQARDIPVADEAVSRGIGPVRGEFYIYDRDREVRRRLPDETMEKYLDETGGVRVYRDGIRVYNYGEQGDDWLGLDLRRVNIPTRKISRNIILGAIHLSMSESTGLIEKTNREGFVENEACMNLRRIVLGALATLEAERHSDKQRIRSATGKPDDPVTAKIDKSIEALRLELKKQQLEDQFKPYLEKITADYHDMQETLLSAGMSGLNLAVVFHEVEHGVRALHQTLSKGGDVESATVQAHDLMRLLDGFAVLLRRGSKRKHSARELVAAAHRYNVLRFRYHHVHLICPLLQEKEAGFNSSFTFNLILGALNNLIDNAIHWLRVRWPETSRQDSSLGRKLYIGASHDFKAGPAIVVADNGIGFQQDDPANLMQPFFTRKPEGMGLGLYYANLVMELNGGQLVFPQRGEVEIPDEYDGAVLCLIFKELK